MRYFVLVLVLVSQRGIFLTIGFFAHFMRIVLLILVGVRLRKKVTKEQHVVRLEFQNVQALFKTNKP